jgi:group II intron reverse transcriptase/maturase
MEIITCRENIIHAIRKVKSNQGFNTPGTDGMIGYDFLQGDAEEMLSEIHRQFEEYNPKAIRRVYIPKRNGKQRPLGIPTVVDKIIQTAIANIIEPILEGKFYEHSYGFRPMRQIEHAYAYLSVLVNTDGQRHWIVEGDIKGFFDNVNHNILINKLYKYGIRDKRVLAIIKKILKAEIENIKEVNDIGTPQGGTLSPLLANVSHGFRPLGGQTVEAI